MSSRQPSRYNVRDEVQIRPETIITDGRSRSLMGSVLCLFIQRAIVDGIQRR
jgi:hypothetical protein